MYPEPPIIPILLSVILSLSATILDFQIIVRVHMSEHVGKFLSCLLDQFYAHKIFMQAYELLYG